MLRRSHALLGAALFLLAASFAVWLGTWSPSYQKCNIDQESNVDTKRESNFHRRINTITICESVVANENGSAITAFATIALVVSTIGLWLVTGRVARENSEFLARMERPYIYLFGAYKLQIHEKVSDGDTPFIRFHIANYGRTPGRLEMFELSLCSGKNGPDKPLTDAWTPFRMRQPVYAPNREQTFSETLPDGMGYTQPTEHELVPKLEDNNQLFLWVKVRYRGPFTPIKDAPIYETSACWVLSRSNNRFVEFGGEEMNYVR